MIASRVLRKKHVPVTLDTIYDCDKRTIGICNNSCDLEGTKIDYDDLGERLYGTRVASNGDLIVSIWKANDDESRIGNRWCGCIKHDLSGQAVGCTDRIYRNQVKYIGPLGKRHRMFETQVAGNRDRVAVNCHCAGLIEAADETKYCLIRSQPVDRFIQQYLNVIYRIDQNRRRHGIAVKDTVVDDELNYVKSDLVRGKCWHGSTWITQSRTAAFGLTRNRPLEIQRIVIGIARSAAVECYKCANCDRLI